MTCGERSAGPGISAATWRACASSAAIVGTRVSDLFILTLCALLSLSPFVAAADVAPAPALAVKAELQTALYLGTLLTLDQDQGGALHRGQDLVTLRLVAALPLPLGIRFGGRMDLTSLGAIDPSNLDIQSLRTIETYGALSWSRKWAGFDVGAAVAAGALVPVEGTVEWRHESLFAGGFRVGRGRSWAYPMVGKDGAADAACGCEKSWRFIVPASVEFKRFALIGDLVTGPGGRKRGGVLVRIPMP